jgi:hypothetical protein
VGSDPRFSELGLFKDSIWMSMAGVGPITKSGRVRKNRAVLSMPEREKRVLAKRETR